MRHGKPDKIAQPVDVLSQEAKCLSCRSGSDRLKEHALTRGDLPIHALDREKSAEAIVVSGNEP